MTEVQLSSSNHSFFKTVARAAFTNPFSEERSLIDVRLAGLSADVPDDLIIPAVQRKLEQRLSELSCHDFKSYSGSDRENLEMSILFMVFHEYLEKFDQHIQLQLDKDGAPLPVTFGRRIVTRLLSFGFSELEVSRYIGLFFQLRRAYFFISKRIVGTGKSMIRLRCQLWNNVFTFNSALYLRYFWNRMEDFSTLLTGETGTGKGTAAAAIGQSGYIPFHIQSNRFVESFVTTFNSVNFSEYPETLLEAELFGHRKGAFTGAIESREGIFSRCSAHGAILLDEIGEVPEPVQIKLLNVLQERTFSPVGSREKKRFSGRVIAATNSDLKMLRSVGKFRDDFYYRLCSDVITIPTLRIRISEQEGELERLIVNIVNRFVGQDAPELVALCHKVILKDLAPDYEWPGNFRELQQRVRRVVLTRSAIEEGTPAPLTGSASENPFFKALSKGQLTANEVLGYYCRQLYSELESYEEVGRRIDLDRRTVKKYIDLV